MYLYDLYFREVLQALSIKKIKLTSPVPTKIDVKSDQSEPQMDVMFSKFSDISLFSWSVLMPTNKGCWGD